MIGYLGNSLNSLSNKILKFFFFSTSKYMDLSCLSFQNDKVFVSIANTYINELHNFHL